MGRLWERLQDLSVPPLLVVAAWVYATFKLIRTGYIQTAWQAGKTYKRDVTTGAGEEGQ